MTTTLDLPIFFDCYATVDAVEFTPQGKNKLYDFKRQDGPDGSVRGECKDQKGNIFFTLMGMEKMKRTGGFKGRLMGLSTIESARYDLFTPQKDLLCSLTAERESSLVLTAGDGNRVGIFEMTGMGSRLVGLDSRAALVSAINTQLYEQKSGVFLFTIHRAAGGVAPRYQPILLPAMMAYTLTTFRTIQANIAML